MSNHAQTAGRVAGLGLSLIRRMNQDAPEGCLSLGLGEPGWAMPAAGLSALAMAAEQANCPYGPNQGLAELEKALSVYTHSPKETIMVCAGSQAALFALFQAYAEPDTQVLLPDPGFLAYPALADLCGAEVLRYPLGPDGSLDADAFARTLATSDKPSLAVINHPANPGGGGAGKAALRLVAEACTRRGTLLISDEVYRELYLDQPCPGLRDVSEHGIVLGSASKMFAAPGLRVGWAQGAAALLAPARLVHNYMNTAPARPSQLAVAAMLADSAACLAWSRAALAERWQAMATGLERELGLSVRPPAGGFYLLVDLPEAALSDPLAWCLRLRDRHRVIVVPGIAFGPAAAAQARLSFAGNPADCAEALRRLAAGWEDA